MKRTWMITAAVLAGAAGAVLSAGTAHAATSVPALAPTAVFVQTDNTSGNTVVAYDRTPTGTLKQAGSYPTGGKGGQLSGSVVDHLASEHSLVYDAQENLLYAVNAGSNTITVFGVQGDKLSRLQVISSGGQFPVSIAVHGSQVYVLNALGGGSVTGFIQFGDQLIAVPAWNRALSLGTTSSTAFTNTPGEVTFTPDGRYLLVTTKNAGNTIDAFAVGRYGPSQTPTVTSVPGTLPFGMTFDSYGHLAVAEAAVSAVATFSIAQNGALTQLSSIPAGGAVTCWVTTADGRLFASNAGSSTESTLSSNQAGGRTVLSTAATDAGTVDATPSADGHWLYVQTGGTGVVDVYYIESNGSLLKTGSVTVPNAAGGEGIAAQ